MKQLTLTARKILDAAIQEFGESGFEGARMDEIARLSGFNKAAIYYHFGNKEALYQEVLFDVISLFAETVVARVADVEEPIGKLRTFIMTIAEILSTTPFITPMLLREMASGAGRISAEVMLQSAKMIMCLHVILSEGKEKGVLKSTHTVLTYMSIMGTLNLFNSTSPIRRQVEQNQIFSKANMGDIDVLADVDITAAGQFICEMIVQSLSVEVSR